MEQIGLSHKDILVLLMNGNKQQNNSNKFVKNDSKSREKDIVEVCHSGPCPGCGKFHGCWSCIGFCDQCGTPLTPS